MLCDVSKIHTGWGIMPKVTHVTDDDNWGQPGSSKKIHVAKSLTQSGGFSSVDRILERNENRYWKIQVDEFQSWMLSFYKFVGVWKTRELAEQKVFVEYTYYLHSNTPLLYPLNYIFAQIFWKAYMWKVLENVRKLAYTDEPYLYG